MIMENLLTQIHADYRWCGPTPHLIIFKCFRFESIAANTILWPQELSLCWIDAGPAL